MSELQRYNIDATENDMSAINILFGDTIPTGMATATTPEEINQLTINGLFGAANGIMRSALLLKYVAANKPEIFVSLIAIADAISTVGEELVTRFEANNNMESDNLDLQPIIDILSKIHIDLPEELQALKKVVNQEQESNEPN